MPAPRLHEMVPSLAHTAHNEHVHQVSSRRCCLVLTESFKRMQISVCGLELWPEARKCEDDWRLGQGVLFGSLLMGWTLYIGI